MPIPDPNSLHALVLGATSQDALKVRGTLSAFYNDTKSSIDARYDIVKDESTAMSTAKILDILFDEDNLAAGAVRDAVFGAIDRKEFERQFKVGRKIYKNQLLDGPLLGVFMKKSFPETFFHPDIARVLAGTGKLTNPATVEERIKETGAAILDALEKDNGLAIMLAIGVSHNRRPRQYYNFDTAEYTLLTFSYFGAKASNSREEDWFFYWRVFGSLLGLPPDRLHRDYDHAQARMKELHKQCPSIPDINSEALLRTFVGAFYESENDIKEAASFGLISKRMEAYLRAKGHWPAMLPNRHSD